MMEVRAQLVVRVTPNARRSEILGWGMDEKGRSVLMVKLAAAPVDGKANLELIKFIAGELNCAKKQVVLLRGEASRQKVLEVPEASLGKLPAR
jgi:uncharacterized protein (TIGR00251 family)